MKILITGAAGFIGFSLAKRLLERGDSVVGIDNMNDYYPVALKRARLGRLRRPSFRFIEMDIADRKALPELFASEHFDCVVNLAAQAGVRYSIENPEITEPKVPEKEGYTGVWEKYELNFKNARVVAVYTKIEPGDPDAPVNPDNPGKQESGCKGGLSSAALPAFVLVAAAFVLVVTLKRKRG